MLSNLTSDGWESLGKRDEMLVFRALSHFAKTWMIAVLLAVLGIPAGCLKMSVSEWTDPDVSPSGRNSQRPDPPENVRLPQFGPVSPNVCEALSEFSTSNSGTTIGDVA